MRFEANEKTLPRFHLIGTTVIVVFLTLTLGGYFSWRDALQHRESLQRVAQAVQVQQQARLTAELDSASNFLEFSRSRTEDVLKRNLRDQVDSAMQTVQAIYDHESSKRSSAEVQHLILEALRPARFFEGRGYFFIDTMQGKFVLLPTAPQFEGRTNLDNRDDQGHFIMRGLIDAAHLPSGEGFSRYRWYMPDNPKLMADKLAYVRHFAPYDWLIGTGDYTYKWEQLQKQEVLNRLRVLRFGSSGYIAVLDRDGRSLLSPLDPSLEGKLPANMSTIQGPAIAQLMARAGAGGGSVRYTWPTASGNITVNKTALVRQVEPWGWVLVAAIQDDEMQAAVQKELDERNQGLREPWENLFGPLLLSLLLGVAASMAFGRWSRKMFARYHAELQLKSREVADNEALFRAVFENAAVGIAQVAPNGKLLNVNQQFCQQLGYSREEIFRQNLDFQCFTSPEDLVNDLARMQQLLEGQGDGFSHERRYIHKDGHILWVNLAVKLVRDEQGVPRYFIYAVSDISQRKVVERDLMLSASVFSHAREGIMITDRAGTIIDVNDSFTRITGFSREESLGQNPRILNSGRQNQAYFAAMWETLVSKGYWHGEVWNRRKNGEEFAEMQTISAVLDEHGQTQHYVSLFSDITSIKRQQQQLQHMAHFDALTGLPNRVLLADRLKQAMRHVVRRTQLLAVVYLDLDGFKLINDTHGHSLGDQVLVALAGRIKKALREGDTLARIGGDEFVAVLVDLANSQACEPLLRRMLTVASEPLLLNGKTVQVSASLGVTFYPQSDGIDADQLQRQADQAMYQAKLAGKNRYHVFDAEQDRSMRGHHESLAHIRQALEHDELVLFYQPKVNMRTGQVIGVEALIRWQHPQKGLLSPSMFLPAIENHDLAVEVGEWVMHAALTQIQAWHALDLNIPVSVNVGARQLQQEDFVARLQSILEAHPEVTPKCLQLEVLETSALEDITWVSNVIVQCQQMGVMFALDDFGTGYSSLTYLKRLPVSQLKIDQSFVRDMLNDPEDLAILQGVIGLATVFKREVIAEGVETVAHGVALLELGCELGQGYGIARPMPAAEVPAWVAAWRPDPGWVACAPRHL
jgi:diguanylate cyclase (GGDEF)-like protein/PAS domain S-box-containing protein